MKARVHVDYLSHDWEASDVICAHTQIHKQVRTMGSKLGSDPDNKSLRLEYQRLSRYQNALWRQMARTCTSRLGKHNTLVHPSTVNWQKESDITWLYGPLYADEEHQYEMMTTASNPLSTTARDTLLHHQTQQQQQQRQSHHHDGLKPVLKSSIYVRRRREQDSICSGSSSSTIDERIPSFSSIASTSSSASIPPPSTPTHSNFVRFSPESTKIQYFIPESPVREFLGGDEGWNPYWSYEDDEDDDQEDDDLWEFMVGVTSRVKDWFIPPRRKATPTAQNSSSSSHTSSNSGTVSSCSSNSNGNFLELVFTLISVTKSVASLMATWVVYQGLIRMLWVVRRPAVRQRQQQQQQLQTDKNCH